MIQLEDQTILGTDSVEKERWKKNPFPWADQERPPAYRADREGADDAADDLGEAHAHVGVVRVQSLAARLLEYEWNKVKTRGKSLYRAPDFLYRVAHQVEPNLPLTSKQKFRIGLACPGQAKTEL